MFSVAAVLAAALVFFGGHGVVTRTSSTHDIIGGGPVVRTSTAAPAPTADDIIGGGPVV
jgi:hypothetical protein